jgi:OOP family OmpA-OmpF porin
VFDGIDKCADTPRGASVNATGCPSDSDSDGVLNGIDRCPNTPRGTEVDGRGCAVPQPDPEPDPEPEPIVVENVLFGVDSSELTSQARSVLDRAGRAIRERRDVVIELDGHTDSTASEVYNEGLSERRVLAVRGYLVANFGITRDRFEVQNLGESHPTADNGSDRGRSLNRRVEVRVRD